MSLGVSEQVLEFTNHFCIKYTGKKIFKVALFLHLASEIPHFLNLSTECTLH